MNADRSTSAFEAAAEELYTRGTPDSFVARRTELARAARAAGEREDARRIARLRRPTTAAAVLNRLSSERLDAITDLATRMQAATAHLDQPELRELGRRRTELLTEIVGALDVGPGVREEVRSTLQAAVADPAAGEALASRRLVRALSYAGLGEVDLSDAVAHEPVPPEPPQLRVVEPSTDPQRERAVQALTAAERRLAAAQAAYDAARQVLREIDGA